MGSLTEGFEVTSSVERGEIVVATDHGAVDEYLGECPHPTTALNGRVTETLDRRVIWRAQTPQMFRRSDLGLALSSALSEHLPITDESTAMELSGFPVSVLEGPATIF